MWTGPKKNCDHRETSVWTDEQPCRFCARPHRRCLDCDTAVIPVGDELVGVNCPADKGWK
jgi:hypothetical protein